MVRPIVLSLEGRELGGGNKSGRADCVGGQAEYGPDRMFETEGSDPQRRRIMGSTSSPIYEKCYCNPMRIGKPSRYLFQGIQDTSPYVGACRADAIAEPAAGGPRQQRRRVEEAVVQSRRCIESRRIENCMGGG